MLPERCICEEIRTIKAVLHCFPKVFPIRQSTAFLPSVAHKGGSKEVHPYNLGIKLIAIVSQP